MKSTGSYSYMYTGIGHTSTSFNGTHDLLKSTTDEDDHNNKIVRKSAQLEYISQYEISSLPIQDQCDQDENYVRICRVVQRRLSEGHLPFQSYPSEPSIAISSLHHQRPFFASKMKYCHASSNTMNLSLLSSLRVQ
jgi:hypothetical protein